MTVTTIKKTDYIKLVGLLALVDGHMKSIADLERAICSIVGSKFNEGGHVSDTIYGFDGERRADDLLEKMEIKVKRAD